MLYDSNLSLKDMYRFFEIRNDILREHGRWEYIISNKNSIIAYITQLKLLW